VLESLSCFTPLVFSVDLAQFAPGPTDLITIGVAVHTGELRILWPVYLSTVRASVNRVWHASCQLEGFKLTLVYVEPEK